MNKKVFKTKIAEIEQKFIHSQEEINIIILKNLCDLSNFKDENEMNRFLDLQILRVDYESTLFVKINWVSIRNILELKFISNNLLFNCQKAYITFIIQDKKIAQILKEFNIDCRIDGKYKGIANE